MNKKYYLYIIMAMFIMLISCGQNPMNADVITKADFDTIVDREGIITVLAPSKKAIYMKFTEDGVKTDVAANSKDWHISSADATWRFSSNSGTTASKLGSAGKGGVKVYKNVDFDSITSINHIEGLLGDWKEDALYNYSDGQMVNQSLNYYLTKTLKNSTDTTSSETYLFFFLMTGMGYVTGIDYIFIVKDGNGDNYVKIQPVGIETDGSGMSFDNRKYMFKYKMSDSSGNF